MNNNHLSRRSVLKWAGFGMAGAALSGLPCCATASGGRGAASGRAQPRVRVGRLAHLTDIHVEPELRAGDGMASCLQHVQALTDRPRLVLTGGDLVYDSYDQGEKRTKQVWDLFNLVAKNECSIPMQNTLGNHDIWGWNRGSSKLTGQEPMFGKRYAMDRLGMAMPYYSFDFVGDGKAKPWRVIVLDSVRQVTGYGNGDNWGYMARLEDEQFDWLERTLRDTAPDQHVMMISHVPILAICSLMPKDASKPLQSNRSLVHEDGPKIHALLLKYPNVKLCLSGHMHENERIDYDGVSYICGGAVCGSWWKGRHKQCDEGYGIVDLFSDGSFAYAYEKYGWKAEVPPAEPAPAPAPAPAAAAAS